MILNKFSHPFFAKIKTLGLALMAFSLYCCKKTANENANKAFVNAINTAYNTGPITISFEKVPLFTDPLAFGQSTGDSINPYDTTTAGVHELQLFQGSTQLLVGNTAFQQQAYYSMFVYDTLNQNSIKIIVFQNSTDYRTDTFTNIRYLNFTPGSNVGIKVVYPRDSVKYANRDDTVDIGPSLFVGYDPNPAVYDFSIVHIGRNDIYAFTDSASPYRDPADHTKDSSNFRRLGSLQFDSTKNYNVYLQGFLNTDTGVNKFQIRSFIIN